MMCVILGQTPDVVEEISIEDVNGILDVYQDMMERRER